MAVNGPQKICPACAAANAASAERCWLCKEALTSTKTQEARGASDVAWAYESPRDTAPARSGQPPPAGPRFGDLFLPTLGIGLLNAVLLGVASFFYVAGMQGQGAGDIPVPIFLIIAALFVLVTASVAVFLSAPRKASEKEVNYRLRFLYSLAALVVLLPALAFAAFAAFFVTCLSQL